MAVTDRARPTRRKIVVHIISDGFSRISFKSRRIQTYKMARAQLGRVMTRSAADALSQYVHFVFARVIAIEFSGP